MWTFVVVISVAASVVSAVTPVSKGPAPALRGARLIAVPEETYRLDCGKRVRTASLAQTAADPAGPGAGMDAEFSGPGDTVLMDGYLEIDCYKDNMYYHGDAHGDNRHDYNLGDTTHVSIVHYDAHVAKEDRKAMTPATCFEFCRAVPEMGFFGITNGRHCYCAPYVEQMAGDSSSCDAVCDGDKTRTCGGKTKSSIFSMHECKDTIDELEDALSAAKEVAQKLPQLVQRAETINWEDGYDEVQAALGNAGDTAAADLMQQAKVVAGEVGRAAMDAQNAEDVIWSLDGEVQHHLHDDSTEGMAKSEQLITQLNEATANAIAAARKLDDLLAQVDHTQDDANADRRHEQYFHAMYFVDKQFVNDTSTCGGKLSAKPLAAKNEEACAGACDKDLHDCVGYSYFRHPISDESVICFLFAKVETLTHYTKCSGEASMCALKVSKFEGTSIKPDGSGKCEGCLTKLTQADRCYE